MDTNELIAALTVAETNRMAAGRGGGSVWVEDEDGYRQIESVKDADGGVYIRLLPITQGAVAIDNHHVANPLDKKKRESTKVVVDPTDVQPNPTVWPECSECGVAWVLRRAFTLTQGTMWVWQRDCKHKVEPILNPGALSESSTGDDVNKPPSAEVLT